MKAEINPCHIETNCFYRNGYCPTHVTRISIHMVIITLYPLEAYPVW